MADTTTDERKLSREDAATFLRSLADDLGEEDQRIGVPVGNKEVQLSPPETVDLTTTVTERSRRLRKDTEELSLTFKWNPATTSAEPKNESGTSL